MAQKHSRLPEAVCEYEEMLRLNQNDNQGVRYNLLCALLALGRFEAARRLFASYSEADFSAVFAWNFALERFLSGDEPGARDAIKKAPKLNHHIENFLTGQRSIPKALPSAFSIGSLDEAKCFAEPLRVAWRAHPAAIPWLMAQKKSPRP